MEHTRREEQKLLIVLLHLQNLEQWLKINENTIDYIISIPFNPIPHYFCIITLYRLFSLTMEFILSGVRCIDHFSPTGL